MLVQDIRDPGLPRVTVAPKHDPSKTMQASLLLPLRTAFDAAYTCSLI